MHPRRVLRADLSLHHLLVDVGLEGLAALEALLPLPALEVLADVEGRRPETVSILPLSGRFLRRARLHRRLNQRLAL